MRSSLPAVERRSGVFVRAIALTLAAVASVYLAIAYGLLPEFWKSYARRHPLLSQTATVTNTGAGLPADPLNVVLVGSEDEVLRIMKAARWDLAVRLGVRADLRLATDATLGRSDPDAPVSTQYLFGRPEDLAFERQVDGNPRHRHHVRLWRTDQSGDDDRPQWIGAAVYDSQVGFSHLTGQVTHAISPDVDEEREFLFQSLNETAELREWHAVDGFHTVREGRNGDGNAWKTDGRLFVGTIKPAVE